MATYRTRNVGASKVIDSDNFDRLMGKMTFAAEVASRAGAQQAVREARSILETRGDGTWPPNSPLTIKRKGHTTVMVDSGALEGFLRIEKGEGDDRLVGFFDDIHPATGGRLTAGELASIHEHPIEHPELARPWLSKVADDDSHAKAVIGEMRAAYWAALERGRGGIKATAPETTTLGEFDFSGVV